MNSETLWVLFAMLLVAEAPKLLFPSETNQPTSHELMTRGDFWTGFTLWSRQCGWYLLVLLALALIIRANGAWEQFIWGCCF